VKAVSSVAQISPVAFNYESKLSTPLSWHLTPKQSSAIINFWRGGSSQLRSSKVLAGSLLGCTVE